MPSTTKQPQFKRVGDCLQRVCGFYGKRYTTALHFPIYFMMAKGVINGKGIG
jgi:hypothetical protein